MKMRTLSLATAGIALLTLGAAAQAAPITVINPGGEAYGTAGRVLIGPGGVSPLSDTGFQATVAGPDTTSTGVYSIANNANSGSVRISIGVGDDAPTTPGQTYTLYQVTGYQPSVGDVLTLNYFGRGFARFDNAVDDQVSVLGYVDGTSGLPVAVDTKVQTDVVFGSWTNVTQTYTVPAGSPLIGQNLAFGFYNTFPTTAGTGETIGAFSSVDDISLSVTPAGVPEPTSLALLGLGGLGLLRRRRA